MGVKHKNLFAQVIHPDNLYAAYNKAARGKRYTLGHLQFREHLATNLDNMGRLLANGSYTPGEPSRFMVYEPKAREITAMPFADRVVQHALCNVIEPIFDKVFLPSSYACRTGKGTHAAAKAVQAALRKAGPDAWVLKTDFSKYFASIDLGILNTEFRRKIACGPTLRLLETIIATTGKGLPIGNLTSQLSANLYGHIVDRWLTHTANVKFCRYMDDIVIIARSREALEPLRIALGWFAEVQMRLAFSRWSILPASRGVNFVGYRIWATHKLLRRDSVFRARRKLARHLEAGDGEARRRFLAAWKGHAHWADSHNLLIQLGV